MRSLHRSSNLPRSIFAPFTRSRFLRAKPLVALLLISGMLLISLPPAVSAVTIRELFGHAAETTSHFSLATVGLFRRRNTGQQAGVPAPSLQTVPGVASRAPLSKAELTAKLSSLRIIPGDGITLQVKEPQFFLAVPLDAGGNPIHGLHPDWSTSNSGVLSISKTGRALANKTGVAIVSARIAALSQSIRVSVIPEPTGSRKKSDSHRQKLTPATAARTQFRPANLKSHDKRNHELGLSRARNH